MKLIQFSPGSGRLLLGLLSHLCGLLDRIEKGCGGSRAASQSSGGRKGHMDAAIHGGSHNAGSQFNLENTMHYAVAGDAIKIDDGSAALGICDPRLGTEARGTL